jgi:antitoxin YefM
MYINMYTKEHSTVIVTRRGKPVLAIMTWEDYQSILDTLEILNDAKAVEQLSRSIKEVKEKKTIRWEDAKTRLGVYPFNPKP